MKKKTEDEVYYQKKWEKENIYSYDPAVEKKNTFVIDTPPPTISGALHIGHVFSYTQTDILARFQRMTGKNVFYPMGWDNNGLPTERRVQNLYKITCDPAMSNTDDAIFEELLARKEKKKLSEFLPVSRKTFIKVCSKQTKEDQKAYKKLWCRLGLSVDWNQTYETISPHSQRIAQQSFLDLYKKGFVENRHIPVFWDTQFKTAVAQADMEDRKRKGFYHDIKFHTENGEGHFIISTTRPELLPACVAIAAHPQDERYKKFFHKQAVTPLFASSVPILPSPHADPEKGTGILMICTFGDMEDVHFWKKHNLPLKQVISQDGFFDNVVFEFPGENKLSSSIMDKEKIHIGKQNTFLSIKPDQANRYYKELAGLRVKQARKKIVEILTKTKHLVSEP
ncbi:MAG: class I tRNA ligase family protein, partial [Bdellovibrionales bacterium]|nr:class I tRNA ligase family protein [Bdellovibrionales bacterium]